MKEPQFTIAAVERDVGLSKDVLRVWERRYGFPVPNRDPNGERLYPAGQVLRLRLIKRLMDQGHRPGRLMTTSVEELEALAAGSHGTRPPMPMPARTNWTSCSCSSGSTRPLPICRRCSSAWPARVFGGLSRTLLRL